MHLSYRQLMLSNLQNVTGSFVLFLKQENVREVRTITISRAENAMDGLIVLTREMKISIFAETGVVA